MTPSRTHKFVAVVIGFLCSLVLALAAPIKLDIPAQPLPAALTAFVKQSSLQVVFNPDDLPAVNANELKGEFEAAQALSVLLDGTGVAATRGKGGIFLVNSTAARPGSIDGEVREEKTGRGVSGAKVQLAGTNNIVTSDKRGRFLIEGVVAGPQVLLVAAEGMQNTRVTDVSVSAGHRMSLSPIYIPVKKQGTLELDTYTVSAKKNDGTLELDPYAVSGQRQQPFAHGNMDIPRTINDVQPYYIFDSAALDRSGTMNVEEFLKNNLTMNTRPTKADQLLSSNIGSVATIDLRGLGAQNTLILINGRRARGVSATSTEFQPDINGIPMSSIDRIEVLPSSGSGIYGGGAIGGVINIVLKKNYSGGEIRGTYETPFDTNAPRRSATLSYGTALGDGRTRVNLVVGATDTEPLLQQDRPEILQRTTQRYVTGVPNYRFQLASSTPSIFYFGRSQITFKDGTVLSAPTRSTYVPSGTSPSTSSEALKAGLLANAGHVNVEPPQTQNRPNGLLVPFGAATKTQSSSFQIERELTPFATAFVDLSQSSSSNSIRQDTFANRLAVSSTSPTNPFRESVSVKVPVPFPFQSSADLDTTRVSVGGIFNLSGEWKAEMDYSWSHSRFNYHEPVFDFDAVNAAIEKGEVNVFVDAVRYPLALERYTGLTTNTGASELQDIALRAAGPIFRLPAGPISITMGLERSYYESEDSSSSFRYSLTPAQNATTVFYGQSHRADSGYAEVYVPLASKERNFPGVREFGIQASARIERVKAEVGTPGAFIAADGKITLREPNRNGQRFTTTAVHKTNSPTIGIIYKPLASLAVRASYATGFRSPTYDQLVPNITPDPFPETILDPKVNTTYEIRTIGGGNPNLIPENSKSWNAGLIFAPIPQLRINVEYYRIHQFDQITQLSAQTIINDPAFAQRVSRDAATGLISLVNTNFLNLTKRETEGFDGSLEYGWRCRMGDFHVRVAGTSIRHERRQNSIGSPLVEMVNRVSAGGPIKFRTTGGLTWERGAIGAGWSTRYYNSYEQSSFLAGLQGGQVVPSQIYHDVVAMYSFDKARHVEQTEKRARRVMDGLSMQISIINIFDALPPFDASSSSTNFLSPFGDARLRSFQLSVRKRF